MNKSPIPSPGHNANLFLRIRRGEIVLIEGTRLRFERRHASGRHEFLNLESEEPYLIEAEELFRKYAEHKFVFLGNGEMHPVDEKRIAVPLDQLTEKETQDIARWQPYVNAAYAVGAKKTARGLDPIIQAVAKKIQDEKPPSWQTLVGKIRLFERVGKDTRAFIRLNRNKGNPYQSRLSCLQNEFFNDAILSVRLTPGQYSKQAVVDRVTANIAKANRELGSAGPHIPTPHRSTIYRHLKWMDEYLELAAREGKEAADRKFKPAFAGRPATRIGEVYEIDHHLCDVFLYDKDSMLMLGRPWLTLVIDRYSRMIMGFYLTFGAPSWHSTAQALKMAIAPKETLVTIDGQEQRVWMPFGVPETIVTDNGPELKSVHFVTACEKLGISEIVWAARYKPNYKGIVERFFRKMEQSFGGSMPNAIREKAGTLPSQKRKAPKYAVSLDVYQEKFVDWVLGVYSHTPHTATKRTPAAMWREGVKLHPPKLPRAVNDLNVLVMHVKNRTLHQYGIELNNLKYNSHDVARIRAECGGSIKLPVRFDPSDIGYVYVTHPKTHQIYQIPCTKLDYADGLSSAVHRAIWSQLQAEGRSSVNDTDLATLRDNIILNAQKATRDRHMTERRRSQILLSRDGDGYRLGKAVINKIESEMNAFDQFVADEDNVAPATHTIASSSPDESNTHMSTEASPLKTIRAQKPKPKKREFGSSPARIRLEDDSEKQHPFSAPAAEPIFRAEPDYSSRVTTGKTGVRIARLDYSRNGNANDEDHGNE